MRNGLRLVSLIATGLFLFGLMVSPLSAATPEELGAYQATVEEFMTAEGEITVEDRAILNEEKGELGLTEQEAAQIEEQVRQTLKRQPQ
jgi:hypothetical protein